MTFIEKIKNYPLVLWALGFYLLSLGFDLRLDVPLAVFAMVSVYALISSQPEHDLKQSIQQHWPVLLFLGTTILATLFSKDIKHSIGVQVHFFPAILVYFVIVHFANEKRLLDFVMVSLIFAAFVAGAVFFFRLVLNELTDPLEKVVSLRSSLFTVPNDVLFLSVLTPLALALGISDSRLMTRCFVGLYLAMTFVLTVYLQSRQAVGLFVLSIFFLVFLHNPRKGFWVGFVLLLVALLFDWLLGKALASKLVLFFPRQYVWGAAWQMFIERPITGFGPGMFKDNYFEYLVKAGYASVEDHRPMKWAHNLYLEQLAERGILGLVALLIMMGNGLRELLVRNDKAGDPWLNRGALSTFGAFILAGVAEASLMRVWVVTLLFSLTAIANKVKKMECYF